MDDSQNIDYFSRDPKHAPVISVQQVTVMGSQNLILWNERTSFWEALQSFDLFFEPPDEFFGFFGIVVGDKIPDFFDVSFRRAGDSNAKLCGHV